MDSSLKQLGNLKSAIGDHLVWGDTPGVTLATQKKLDAQSKVFTSQQKDAQKFFGTGEFVSKDDIKNRLLNNPGELKEINVTDKTDIRGKTEGLSSNSKQSPKLSKEELLAKEGKTWEIATKDSPAGQSGAWDKGERWAIQKEANKERWDKKYESYIKKDDTPAIKQNEIKAQENVQDTTSTNIGAKDLAGKLGGDFGKAYKMIQTGKALASVAKGTKLATAFGAGGAGAAALGPLGIVAAVGLAALAKKGETEGSQNLPGGRVIDEDETMFLG